MKPHPLVVFLCVGVFLCAAWYAAFSAHWSDLFGAPTYAQTGEVSQPPEYPTATKPIIARVYDSTGAEADVTPTLLNVNGKVRVSVEQPKSKFRPGRYTLKVWMLQGSVIYFTESQFVWGVFAANFDKSIYTVGDTARAQMGVLTDTGDTVCDAHIRMTVVAPSGDTLVRTTANGTIRRNPTCGRNNVTQEPDYETNLPVSERGTYEVRSVVVNVNGTREFSDSFEAQDTPAFDVQRTGPTRIYPPALYDMKITIHANQDFVGDVVETIPFGFSVSTIGRVEQLPDEQRIIWPLDLKLADETELSYSFDAPDVSPELYKVGPLQMIPSENSASSGQNSWREARAWQIASDAANTVILISTTASTTWVVPNDWNPASNTIEVVGAGGGGSHQANAGSGGGGGGGGAYAKITNWSSSTIGTSVTIQVGAGGAGTAASAASGTPTYFNGSGAATTCAGASSPSACAAPGGGGKDAGAAAGGPGGATSTSIGATKFRGGNAGGGNTTGDSSGGGGGAAGLSGSGCDAGSGGVSTGGAGGGGGGGPNCTASATATSTVGTRGGSGYGGAVGGGGASSTNALNGSTASGGAAGGGGALGGTGGAGASSTLWTATVGGATAGPGGGGGGSSNNVGGAGGPFGGGGGAGSNANGGAGGNGLIVITYTPADPTTSTISNVVINGGNAITLNVNATKTVAVSFTVTDANYCADVFTNGNVTTTLYRSGVSTTCGVADPTKADISTQNCYRLATTTNDCTAGNTSANATATFDIWYFADATDSSSSYSAQNWSAFVFARDGTDRIGSGSSTAAGVELNTLIGFDVASSTGYGTMSPIVDTGATNTIVSVKNVGNTSTTLSLSGTALTSGANVIATTSQHYATGTFTFGGVEQVLQGTATAVAGFLAAAPPLVSWSTTTALPSPVERAGTFASNNRIYVAGGRNSSQVATTTVRYSLVSATGTPINWSSTTALPAARYDFCAVENDVFAYIIGGMSSTGVATSSVLFGPLASAGGIVNWSTTTALPSPVGENGGALNNGFVYSVGGLDSSGNPTTSVFFGPIGTTSSITNWSTTTPLPSALTGVGAAIVNNTLYAVGGRNATVATTSVFSAPITSTSAVGAWTLESTLASSSMAGALTADSGILYLAGGYNGFFSNTTTLVVFAPVNASGDSPTFSVESALPAARRNHAATAWNGYLYEIGGMDGASSTTSSVIFAPIASKNTYWGIGPGAAANGTYTGTNTFTAVWSP